MDVVIPVRIANRRWMGNSYRFPDVVHRLSQGVLVWPAAQTVNNVAAACRIELMGQTQLGLGRLLWGLRAWSRRGRRRSEIESAAREASAG
jgi:hypothetical protein